MTSIRLAVSLLTATFLTAAPLRADDAKTTHTDVKTTTDAPKDKLIAESAGSDGSVTIGGKPVAYHAVAGTLVVHPAGWQPNVVNDGDGKGDDRKDALAAMLKGKVRIDRVGYDHYGRTLALVEAGGHNIACMALEEGIATYKAWYDNEGRIRQACKRSSARQ